MNKFLFFFITTVLFLGCSPKEAQELSTPTQVKPRTIVTTDGEIDDVDSFIRLLLYANEFHLEGLIYSSSMWHYKGDGNGTPFTSEMDWTKGMYGERTELRWPGTTWMEELIAEYEKVYPNLILHAAGYPTPEYLKSLIRIGNIDFEGEMEKDTEGSDFIKGILMDDNTEPIYLQVWGGTNTIARALKSIEDEYKNSEAWEDIYKKVCDKSIIYAILDQDATYRKYIAPNWPDIKIYYNSNQFWCFAYPWKRAVPEEWQPYLEGEFMYENIINDHGPLMKKYYSYGDGQKQEGDPEHVHGDLTKVDSVFHQYDFISEGDSPAFLHLVDVGLDNLEHPHYGGWGGRLIQSEEQPNRWEDGENAADFNPFTQKMDNTFPQTRWVKTLQNDFAARADWCVQSFAEANHAPTVKILQGNNLSAQPGEQISLSGEAIDPDGDELSYKWWQYAEIDTYNGTVELEGNDGKTCTFTMPADIQPSETIHLILEVSDNHELPMTRYQRIVIDYTK